MQLLDEASFNDTSHLKCILNKYHEMDEIEIEVYSEVLTTIFIRGNKAVTNICDY